MDDVLEKFDSINVVRFHNRSWWLFGQVSVEPFMVSQALERGFDVLLHDALYLEG